MISLGELRGIYHGDPWGSQFLDKTYERCVLLEIPRRLGRGSDAGKVGVRSRRWRGARSDIFDLSAINVAVG